MVKKTIWDYFDESINYPNEVVHNPIPYGTVWCYISSTYLNGIINYVKPISCFVIDRYAPGHEVISGNNITVCDSNGYGSHKWEGTKEKLINSVVNGDVIMSHTNIGCFNDDFIILAEIETNDDSGGEYIFFWFDCDTSDCCVGKFETTDSKEVVMESLVDWLDDSKDENMCDEVVVGIDNGIIDYTELPVTFLKGWVSF